MSIYVDDLRDVGNHHGHQICELAADEIDELEAKRDKLAALNAELLAVLQAILRCSKESGYLFKDSGEFRAARDAIAKAAGESA